MSDCNGPYWNTYEVKLPSAIWIDPLGWEDKWNDKGVLLGAPICKTKGPSFNCKFVPYDRLQKAENKIKKLEKQLKGALR